MAASSDRRATSSAGATVPTASSGLQSFRAASDGALGRSDRLDSDVQPQLRYPEPLGESALATRLPEAEAVSTDWRRHLPVLAGRQVTLRELRMSDAPALLALLSTAEVERFISTTPASIEEFERFILWTMYQRELGEYVCFGVVPEGQDVAVGLFQVRALDPTFGTAEWGFALGRPFWGSGLFAEGARLVIDFVFEAVGAHRLEARATVENGRGNGALAKAGAVRECQLRRSFLHQDGRYVDQALWAIVRDDWSRSRRTPEPDGSVH